MINQIRKSLRRNHKLRTLFGHYIASSGLIDFYFKNYKVSPKWQKRIQDVIRCQDNSKIDRVERAGAITKGSQIMHNGIKINLGSYYGPEVARLLIENRGVHEPQEEYVFQEVLKLLSPNALMIELGSFWAFYSIWFAKRIPQALNFMIEPDDFNIISGRRNFRLNGLSGDFTQAFVSSKSTANGKVPTINIDEFVYKRRIEVVDILHSDIQGYELEMLKGSVKLLEKGLINYFFISTHSNKLHYNCIQFLENMNYKIVIEADLDNTFSEDGLIVAKKSDLKGLDNIRIDKKKEIDI